MQDLVMTSDFWIFLFGVVLLGLLRHQREVKPNLMKTVTNRIDEESDIQIDDSNYGATTPADTFTEFH